MSTLFPADDVHTLSRELREERRLTVLILAFTAIFLAVFFGTDARYFLPPKVRLVFAGAILLSLVATLWNLLSPTVGTEDGPDALRLAARSQALWNKASILFAAFALVILVVYTAA